MTEAQGSSGGRGGALAYWGSTGVLALIIGGGGVADIIQPPNVVEVMQHLGYPLYFAVMLGVWKVLGGIAVAAPGFPRLKEWAYAGIVIDLVGAAVSHAAVGDPIPRVAFPLVLLVVTAVSYRLRPADRRL